MREDVGLSEAFLVLTARGGGWYSGAMDDPERAEWGRKLFAYDLFLLARYVGVHGISQHQMSLMCLLFLNDKYGMEHHAIRKNVGISKSACYDLLDKLEKTGDVESWYINPLFNTKEGKMYGLSKQGRAMCIKWLVDYRIEAKGLRQDEGEPEEADSGLNERIGKWHRRSVNDRMEEVLTGRQYVHDMFLLSAFVSVHGVPMRQVAVICLLYLHEDGMNAREIHKKVHMSRESCYYLLAKLEEAGDVEYRYADPKEKKEGRLYGLTEQGRGMVKAWNVNYWRVVMRKTR